MEPGDAPETLTVRGLTTDLIGDLAHNAGIALHELAPGAGSLEEMFLRWTGDEPAEGSTRRSRLIPTGATTRKEVVRS